MTNSKKGIIIKPTFRTFWTSSGRCEVEQWYDSLSQKERMKVRTRRLAYLSDQPKTNWRYPHYRTLDGGPCDGLGEIRVKLRNVEWRLLGFWGPEVSDFTLVLVTDKKRQRLPKHVCDAAQERKKLIVKHPELAHEWQF